MHKNYFFLNRFIIEANKLLKNFSVKNIFSQEKDRLVIEISDKEKSYFLEISVNPGFPFITLKEEFHRAKKNSIDFFPSLISKNLLSIEIAKFDRIIKLILNGSELYFAIRGKFTNIILMEDKQIESFKKISEQYLVDFKNEVKQINFSEGYNIPRINKIEDSEFKDEIKKYPFIGKEIIKEIEARNKKQNDFPYTKFSELQKILLEIKNQTPSVFINEPTNEIHLAINTFILFSNYKKNEFKNYIEALNFFISKKYFLEEADKKKKKIEKHLNRELKKISSKLNNLKSRIEKGSSEEKYNIFGNLLLINLSKFYKGMEKIEVENIYEENKLISIKLNPKLSPKQNADYYFEKSKSERINYQKSKKLYSELQKEFNKLKDIEKRFYKTENFKDYNFLMKELKIKDEKISSSKEELKHKFKHYIIDGKYHVFVGKDSRNNDLLTTKFAKQNDYWFHVRSVSGSHVVLRTENYKDGIPKNVLKSAASLAAYHSKAKTAGTVPVSFTLKKYVVKKKGMAAGKVALLKEDVLLVKPEIPYNCEYIEND